MTAPRRVGALAAVLAVLAVAGVVPAARAALDWDASLGAGVMANDNLHFDPRTPPEQGRRQPVGETIFTIDPGLRLLWNAERDQLQLHYSGERSQYSGDEQRDPEWVHTLAADLGWRRWAPFFLEAREERARVPRAQQQDTEAIVDQVDRNRASVRSGFGWDLGARGAVELGYRGEWESYPGTADLDRVSRNFGEGLFRYRWSPLWQSELHAAYGRVSRVLNADYAELRAGATVDQRLSELLALRYSLEWIRQKDDHAAPEGSATAETGGAVRSSLLKGAALSGTLERGSWRLSYQDRLEGLSDGDTLRTGRAAADVALRARLGSSLGGSGWYEKRDYRDSGREEGAWGPILTVRWLIVPWAACDLAGSWTGTTIREPGQPKIEDHTVRAAVGIVLQLFDRATLETGYAYRRNQSGAALRSYDDNLLFALLTVHFRAIGAGGLPASYASSLVSSPSDAPGQEAAANAAAGGSGR